jgi:FtsH-binding integral membrane protein
MQNEGLLGGGGVGHKSPLQAVERSIRMGFVRKVYSILSVQLLLTTAIAIPVMRMDRMWLLQHMAVFYAVMALQIVCLCVIMCCHKQLRTYPQNYAFLFVFTATEGALVGLICAGYSGPSVAMAAATTMLIFGMMTVYAWTTKNDFTGAGPYLFAALFTLFSMCLVMAIMSLFVQDPHIVNAMNFAYCGCGALIFSFYIVYDTQKMIGMYGGHKHQFDIDDYCFAALNLYLDVINLFLYILRMMGDKK